MLNILIKYPTRSRPEQFLKILQLYRDTATYPDRLRWLIALDDDDDTMNGYVLLKAYDILKYNLIHHKNLWLNRNHKTKIEAINSGVDEYVPDWDILINIADDMIPIVQGWDEIIEKDMLDNFPNLDGCLWYYDGTQKHICTMAIMGRKAYESLGYIYHPSYISLWCDQEFTQYWSEKKKLVKNTQILFEHIHPASLTKDAHLPKMKWDDLYRRNEDRKTIWDADEKNFNKRRKLGWPI